MNNRRKFETALGDLGYVYDRRNSKGYIFWVHEDSGAELRTVPNMTDSACADSLKKAKRLIGVPTCDNKRHPDEIRARREAQRVAVEKARANLERLRSTGSHAELDAAVRLIEDEERRFHYWDSLMRSAVST